MTFSYIRYFMFKIMTASDIEPGHTEWIYILACSTLVIYWADFIPYSAVGTKSDQ